MFSNFVQLRTIDGDARACDVVSQVARCVSAICGQDGTGPLSTARHLRLHMSGTAQFKHSGTRECLQVN